MLMPLIVKIFNMYGEGEEVAEFEDPLACATFAYSLQQKFNAANELKSVTIVDGMGNSKWNEVMGA